MDTQGNMDNAPQTPTPAPQHPPLTTPQPRPPAAHPQPSPPTFLPPPSITHPFKVPPSIRLLWHVCHLCNIITSQLSAYLSLEVLHRNSMVDGLSVPIGHLAVLQAQGMMLVDMSTNLSVARDKLVQMDSHAIEWIKNPKYVSLLEAAEGLVRIVGGLRGGLKSIEEVNRTRDAYDEMLDLCYGDAEKGIMGWRRVWQNVFAMF